VKIGLRHISSTLPVIRFPADEYEEDFQSDWIALPEAQEKEHASESGSCRTGPLKKEEIQNGSNTKF